MEDAAAAAEMHVSKTHRPLRLDDQQAPPVGGDDVDLDLISRLPDEILGTVVSLLPIKDGARTQALSRRWLPLWRSHMAPLNLVADYHLNGSQTHLAVVSKILSDHPGPARRFWLHIVFFPVSFLDEIACWFSSTALSGLQELHVTNHVPTYRYPLPPHALIRFPPTLRVLRLFGCQIPGLVSPPSFPLLEQLELDGIDISEDSLQGMISGCAVLESVSLHSMGLGRLCITSTTLRSITFDALDSKKGVIQELVIEDAPSLQRLLPTLSHHGPLTIRVIKAPKLEVLGFLSKCISTLHLGTTIFQKMIAVNSVTKMVKVKILALDSIDPNLEAVVDFLKCFPCLEKLYVILLPGDEYTNGSRKYDPPDPIECFQLHLKKVVLKNYDCNMQPCIDFAKFFIMNVKVLKKMEIGVLNAESGEWISFPLRRLQVENRASRDAQIELRGDTYAIATNLCHTHDLSTVDPFEESLCRHGKSA